MDYVFAIGHVLVVDEHSDIVSEEIENGSFEE